MEEKDKWKKLETLLTERGEWPRVYLFKFIVKNHKTKVDEVISHFNNAEVSLNKSKNGNYVSISAKEMMISPSSVIERYKTMGGIEGVLSL